MKIPAIYIITCRENGKMYIGSSKRPKRRLWEHKHFLTKCTHCNIMLSRAWEKYGADAFSFDILEVVEDTSSLLAREQFWIDHYRSWDPEFGFNACPVAGTREGTKQPVSVSDKLRLVHSGKPKSPEQRLKMSIAAKGRPKSEETKQKLREAAERQFSDPAARQKARENAIKQFEDPAQIEMARANAIRIFSDPEVRARKRAAVSASNKRRALERQSKMDIAA
jgi:group I intron endonuclease